MCTSAKESPASKLGCGEPGCGGTIAIHQGKEERLIGTLSVPAETSWDAEYLLSCPVNSTSGDHAITLRFHCDKEGLIRFREFRFSQES